jgi:hypothetical protein
VVPFIGPIIDLVGSLGGSYLDRKKAEAKSKARVAIAKAEGEINWDIAQAEASASSWKDELLCIIFCIPLCMCFIPGLEKYAVRGFEILETMPQWYQYTLGVIVAASFGFRGATKFMGKKK